MLQDHVYASNMLLEQCAFVLEYLIYKILSKLLMVQGQYDIKDPGQLVKAKKSLKLVIRWSENTIRVLIMHEVPY